MGVWLSGENGQDANLHDFAVTYFEKGKFSKFCLCRCKNTIFSHMRAKMAKFSFAPVLGWGHETAFFLFRGMLGWCSCFFGGGHLTWP